MVLQTSLDNSFSLINRSIMRFVNARHEVSVQSVYSRVYKGCTGRWSQLLSYEHVRMSDMMSVGLS